MQEKTQTLELQYHKNKIFNHLLINDIIEWIKIYKYSFLRILFYYNLYNYI